eukprot:5004496-Lingulodinium_polyedra.AAC.1
MRGVYLSEDRPDIKFATKEAARLMQTPCDLGMAKLKHLGRYLLGRPRLVQRMPRQKPPTHAD